MKKTNCVIVHGCPSDDSEEATQEYARHWMPWTKKELNEKGVPTEIALMPEPWHPDYDRFKEAFQKYSVNDDTILVGHSCGSAFLVRWLGETKKEVKKLILVAPWKIPNEGDEGRQKYYVYPIDESIRERVGEIVIFTSNNEADEGKQSVKIFQEALEGKLIELKDHGHYTRNDMGAEAFPELIEEVLK